jgi:predicted nuclease of predicted toxin-antitoxin system
VITNDLDFSAILAATSGQAPSVVQVRTQDLLAEATVSVVATAIEAFHTEIDGGALLSINEAGTREDIASPSFARPEITAARGSADTTLTP